MEGGRGQLAQLDVSWIVGGAPGSAPYQAQLASQDRHGLVDGVRPLAGCPDVDPVPKQADVGRNPKIVHALASPGVGDPGTLGVELVLLVVGAQAADETPVSEGSQCRHHLAHLERGQGLEGEQVILRALVQPSVAGLELLVALAPLGGRLAGQRAGEAVQLAPVHPGKFEGALPGERVLL